MTVLATACAPTRQAARPAQRPAAAAVSLPSPSPLPSASPSPAPSPVAWTPEAQPSHGFDLSLPPGWTPKAAVTGGADHVYYATAAATAPLEMGPNDVWLTVEDRPLAADGSCAVKLPDDDGGTAEAEIQGQHVRLQLRNPKDGVSEPTWKTYAITSDGQRCYVLWFVTLNQAARTRQLKTMQQIVANFMPTPGPLRAPRPAVSPGPVSSPSPSPSG